MSGTQRPVSKYYRVNASIWKLLKKDVVWKDWCWRWNSNTLATWCKELIHWERPWSWERLRAEGDDRGWDGWMASLTQRTWVWVDSRSWWWTGRPGRAAVHAVTNSQTWLSNWTELIAPQTLPSTRLWVWFQTIDMQRAHKNGTVSTIFHVRRYFWHGIDYSFLWNSL